MNGSTLHPVLRRFVETHRLDTVEGAFACQGGLVLSKPGLGSRQRLRLEARDEENRCWEMYLKRYGCPPWRERLWRFLTGRRSFCPARTEFENAQRLRQANVPTLRPIVWGAEQGLWGVRRSYLLMAAVPGDAMERIGEAFLQRYLKVPKVLEEFTDQLVDLVSRLHRTGLVHRDLYASHIFLHDCEGRIELHLIDLARGYRPRWRRFRWRVKDLAQLKYSMPWMWVKMFWERFLHGYLQGADKEHIERWGAVIDAKVAEMVRRDHRRAARKDAACASH